MINKLKLKKIATVYSGYAFRKAVVHSDIGAIKVIQTKDITASESILNTNGLMKISAEIPRSNSFVQSGDVLLASRGAGNHKAAVFGSNEVNVVASASLYIIRSKNKNVLPEYLSLFLNSAEGQNQLSQITTGAYIQNISRSNLEELNIPVPLMEIQETLLALQKNIWQQRVILQRNNEIKNNIISQVIKTIARQK
jgi:hypothetical protein